MQHNSYIVRNLWGFLLEILAYIQRSKGEFVFSEKYHYFTYGSSGMYSMTTCDKSGIKAVYNYKNKDSVIRRGRQNVTSESTPSGRLTS